MIKRKDIRITKDPDPLIPYTPVCAHYERTNIFSVQNNLPCHIRKTLEDRAAIHATEALWAEIYGHLNEPLNKLDYLLRMELRGAAEDEARRLLDEIKRGITLPEKE